MVSLENWRGQMSETESALRQDLPPCETMVLICLSLVWLFLKMHNFNNYQPMANWKQWDACENLYSGLLCVMYSQKGQARIRLGLARLPPWKLRFCEELHGQLPKGKSLSRKSQAPALALPNAQWPSCTPARGHYPCLLCPLTGDRALGLSSTLRLASDQRIILTWWKIRGLGLWSGPVLV